MHFLAGDLDVEPAVEAAMACHDIGLGTNRELACLEPSEPVVVADNDKHGWCLDPDLLRRIIHWHHKIFRYRGPHEQIIETCRKADWIDASMGWIRTGMNRSHVAAVEAAFPNEGFHKSLIRLAKVDGGSTPAGGIRVTRGIVNW